MVSLTLAIPEDIRKEMDKFPEINWSAIAREAIKKRIILLNKINKFSKNSKLTEEDAVKIGRKINKRLSNRYKKK